jgi:hypothetical protein
LLEAANRYRRECRRASIRSLDRGAMSFDGYKWRRSFTDLIDELTRQLALRLCYLDDVAEALEKFGLGAVEFRHRLLNRRSIERTDYQVRLFRFG